MDTKKIRRNRRGKPKKNRPTVCNNNIRRKINEERTTYYSQNQKAEKIEKALEVYNNLNKKDVSDCIEAFVSNIPFKINNAPITAENVVEFFLKTLSEIREFSLQNSKAIIRCEFIRKNGGFAGSALVIFTKHDYFHKLKDIADASLLVFGGRKLRIQEGYGNSLRHLKFHTEQNIFHPKLMQLGLPIFKNNHTEKALLAPFEEILQFDTFKGSSLELDMNRYNVRCIVMRFSYNNQDYSIEFPMRLVRDILIEKNMHTESLPENLFSLTFQLRRPANIFTTGSLPNFKKDNKIFDLHNFFDALDFMSGGMAMKALLRGINSGGLWELDDFGDDDDSMANWIRTIDPTENNLFGICTTYRLLLLTSDYSKIMQSLFDFGLIKSNHLNITSLKSRYTSKLEFPTRYSLQNWNMYLPFSILYLLHCLLGGNKITIHSLKSNKVVITTLLKSLGGKRSEEVLLHLFVSKKYYFITNLVDAINEVESHLNELYGYATEVTVKKTVTNEVRRVLITPLRICPQPPEQETTNRVIRHFIKHKNRFIRVVFVEENFGSILSASSDHIFEGRVRSVIRDGIEVGGRHFVFLAYSNSQLREQSCWFYYEDSSARDGSPTANYIRDWIGDLSNINIVGKFAARLGQGFSSTVSTLTVQDREIQQVDDVTRNGYCFSDGVGLISSSFAKSICKVLGLKHQNTSAFQIRFGGAKGVLAVSPDGCLPEKFKIGLRPSMVKFETSHSVMEISSYSKKIPAYLNRQLITVLSSRSIPDSAFLDLYENMMASIDRAFTDQQSAIQLLQYHGNVGRDDKSLSPLAAPFHMLLSGCEVANDRYLYGSVAALRNKLILDIQLRARIFIPDAVCLIGVMDETHTLQPGQIFVQLSIDTLNTSTATSLAAYQTRILEGVVAVGRSPALHPGDVRVLTAVDIPGLHHLVDVVVFPATGNRPHPNEMGGGDLDGDLYFVIQDPTLIPEVDYPPMIYVSPLSIDPSRKEGGISGRDKGDFFVDYIKNDNLGQIANAHVVHADVSYIGARCDPCLKLAELHSTAVDFVKTGVPAKFPPDLRTPKVPDFMDNPRKVSYESKKVLGKIFRHCKQSRRLPELTIPLTGDVCYLIPGYEDYVDSAESLMVEYNHKLWKIMEYFEVMDEMELLSGNISRFSRKQKTGGRKEDLQGRVNAAVKELKVYYREIFWDHILPDDIHNEFDGKDDIVNEEDIIFVDNDIVADDHVTTTIDDEEKGENDINSNSNSNSNNKMKFEGYSMDYNSANNNTELKVDDIMLNGFSEAEGGADQTQFPYGQYLDEDMEIRAMKQAAAWYYCAYSQTETISSDVTMNKIPPLISFPWVVYDILCKNRSYYYHPGNK